MEYLLGLLTTASLFVVYLVGKKQGSKQPARIQIPITGDEAEERVQQAEKAKEIRKHFQRLMDYDVDKALERDYKGR